ncbi:MAG: epoxyqueuosine reductase QueH [Lachnospiraceae bacterium]
MAGGGEDRKRGQLRLRDDDPDDPARSKMRRRSMWIGREAADACGVAWLPSDFKKKNGYRRSVELSAEYGLYRQDYCGCVFSKQEREASK